VPNINPLPHPNAAKVYINWFYSKAGQQAFVDIIQQPSARVDVDMSKLPEYLLPKPEDQDMNAAQFLDEKRLKATRDDVTEWHGN
jgi:ABC-type Fe3+ transport system substrate-binding protein